MYTLCIVLFVTLLVSLILLWKRNNNLITLPYTSTIEFTTEKYTFKCVVSYNITGTIQSHKYVKSIAESIFKYYTYQLTKGIKPHDVLNNTESLCEELKQMCEGRFNYDNTNELIYITNIKIIN